MANSPQHDLERAVRMGDALAVRDALEAGADPNQPNGQGIPPLGQVFLSSWQRKIIQRFSTMRQTDPKPGAPGYWALEDRRAKMWRNLIIKMHAQSAKLAHLLIASGADVNATWTRPHPDRGMPPVRVSAAVLALNHELEGYQRHPVPRVEESLARLQPWMERTAEWPAYNPIEDRPGPHSVLDELEWMLYAAANDDHEPSYDDSVHSFLGGFIRTVAEYNTPQADRWLAQAAASDVPLYPNALAGMGGDVQSWVAQGHHCRQSRARQADLVERAAPPAPSSRRRRA